MVTGQFCNCLSSRRQRPAAFFGRNSKQTAAMEQLKVLALAVLVLTRAAAAASAPGPTNCTAEVVSVAVVAEGDSYGEGAADIAYLMVSTELPALCAVKVRMGSSATSSYRFAIVGASRRRDPGRLGAGGPYDSGSARRCGRQGLREAQLHADTFDGLNRGRDAVNGLADGIISAPDVCRFDLAAP